MPKTKIKLPRSRHPSRQGMQNRRYRKTEEAILEVLLRSRRMPNTTELTKRAHISRSTLYRHHRAMPGIIPDYERDTLIAFKRESKKILNQKEPSLENTYLKILIFVLRYKRVFKILFKYSGDRVVENMVSVAKTPIASACHLPKNSDRMFKIYAKEVAGIVEDWGEKGFPEDRINRILKDVIYLTSTMYSRLSPVRE